MLHESVSAGFWRTCCGHSICYRRYAAVSGASTATAAVFSRVAIPEMLKYGYSQRLAAGVVAAGGTLASLIPPSAILVIYAIIVEESIGRLLVAGFIPGIVSAIIYAALIIFMAARNPELGPPVKGFTWNDRLKRCRGLYRLSSLFLSSSFLCIRVLLRLLRPARWAQWLCLLWRSLGA